MQIGLVEPRVNSYGERVSYSRSSDLSIAILISTSSVWLVDFAWPTFQRNQSRKNLSTHQNDCFYKKLPSAGIKKSLTLLKNKRGHDHCN